MPTVHCKRCGAMIDSSTPDDTDGYCGSANCEDRDATNNKQAANSKFTKKVYLRTLLIKGTQRSHHREGYDRVVHRTICTYDMTSVKKVCIEITPQEIIRRIVVGFMASCFVGPGLYFWLGTWSGYSPSTPTLFILLGVVVWFVVAWTLSWIGNAPVTRAANARSAHDQVEGQKVKVVLESSWKDFISKLVDDGEVIASQTEHISGVEKRCGKCGKRVHADTRLGESCPHCGYYWAGERRK